MYFLRVSETCCYGSGSCEGANLSHRHLSPSQASGDDEASGDSYSGNGDLNDALSLARDRSLISRALDTMAKVRISAVIQPHNFKH